MGDPLRPKSVSRLRGPISWVLSLLLVAVFAGLAVFGWQQPKVRAAQDQNEELSLELGEAQDAWLEQRALSSTLEAERVELLMQLDGAKAQITDLQAAQSALAQSTVVAAPTEPPMCLGCTAIAYHLPHCAGYGTQEELRSAFSSNRLVRVQLIDSFFSDPTVASTWENGTLYQMCYSKGHEISFVVYGEFEGFEETNNLIGVYNGERMIAHRLFNPSSGDIGLCTLQGYIEGNVVFACGGGDGPGGWNTVFVLDHLTGESKTIMDCTYFEGESTCTVNRLDLPR